MSVPDRGLEAFLHLLIPAELRQTLKPNTAAYIRVRALSAMLIIVTGLSGVSNLLVAGTHFLVRPTLLINDLVSLVVFLLLALQTWLFYKYKNYWLSGMAFTNFYFLTVTFLLILSGGYKAVGIPILFTCPMMAFLLGGRQEGIQNSFLSILFIFALVLLQYIEFELPNVFSDESPDLIFIVNWIFTLVVIFTTVMVYEVELDRRADRLSPRSDPTRAFDDGLSRRVQTFILKLIPAKLQKTITPNMTDYVRVKIISILLLTATTLCLLSASILVTMHALFNPDHLKYDWIIAGILLFFILQVWLFYQFGNYRLSGRLLSYFYFFIVLFLVVLSGGYGTPLLPLFLICPLLTSMIGGLRDSFMTALSIGMIGIAFNYLDKIGIQLDNVFHAVSQPMVFAIVWCISIVGVAVGMFTYDIALEKLD